MRFVITGKAYINGQWVYRADFERLAEKQGHYVNKVVDGFTDYLVTDHLDKWTQKRLAADWHGTKIISSEEFLDIMGGTIELTSTLGV